MARFDYNGIELPEEERLYREGTHPAEVVGPDGRRLGGEIDLPNTDTRGAVMLGADPRVAPGPARPAEFRRAPVSFIDMPGERERGRALEDAARLDARRMADTRADRMRIAMQGGSTTRQNAAVNRIFDDWDRRNRPLDLAERQRMEIRAQDALNLEATRGQFAVDAARETARGAAALQNIKNEGAATVQDKKNEGAQIAADGKVKAETIKAEAQKAIREMEQTPEGAAAVGGARAAAARTGRAQGLKLEGGGYAVIMPDGSSYIVDMRGERTDHGAPQAAQPAAPASPPPPASQPPASQQPANQAGAKPGDKWRRHN